MHMTDTTFSVTDNAAQRIAFLASREAKPVMMRVAVLGGGCSGFQYSFSFEEGRNDDDLVIERNGAAVLVDSTSLELLKGSELDYVSEMVGSSFQVKNPNATSSCGCGNSFSV
jgi:iron-sulfur cluster insertion protein